VPSFLPVFRAPKVHIFTMSPDKQANTIAQSFLPGSDLLLRRSEIGVETT
jgi:hypothetical protein